MRDEVGIGWTTRPSHVPMGKLFIRPQIASRFDRSPRRFMNVLSVFLLSMDMYNARVIFAFCSLYRMQ